MPDKEPLEDVKKHLDEALLKMKSLEERMARGEDIEEEEMAEIAKMVAYSLMDANDKMKSMFPPEMQAEVEAKMIGEMSDEEYTDWSANYGARQAMREARRLEGEHNG